MTKEELIEALNSLNKLGDPEVGHGKADDLIIDFINDKEIEEAYNKVDKRYA